MGWNSWDCYGASVTEKELMQNADFVAEHLKAHGWEYIVCDIQWYEPTADSSHYHAFADLCMDEYGRLLPAVNRFPSAAGGKGFGPIADYIHSRGLKFGIHIMRGIPRQAVFQNTPVKGTDYTARQVAHPSSVCCWNTDMYGVDAARPGAQAYYDSIIELYASWGVDFIKVDDICVKYVQPGDESVISYGGDEIELLRVYILKAGRNDGDTCFICICIIIHRTKDDVRIVACHLLYVACRVVCIPIRDISGNVDDDVGCALNGRLKQRAGNCLLYCLQSLVVTLSLSDTDMCDTLVLHNGLNICKVEVDQCRQVDQVGDTLYCLLQYLVCLLQCLRHCRPAVYDLKQLVIRNYNQRIHILFETLDSCKRIVHTGTCLKTERLL